MRKPLLNENRAKKISKLLSLILRHQPETVHITLDDQGWVDVNTLLANIEQYKRQTVTREMLNFVVETNNKKRFAFNDDGTKIRASQGHSVKIDLGYEPTTPPEFLYHGTATRFLQTIEKEGLKKRSRHHVHLSLDHATATNVGTRHGLPVILKVHAQIMHEEGYEFFVSENGVWLTEEIPVKYFDVLH